MFSRSRFKLFFRSKSAMNSIFQFVYCILSVMYYCAEAFITVLIPKSFRTTKSIYGEIALITGAGSGIGRLIAIRLAKLGAKIVLWDVNTAGLEQTKALIEKDGGEATMYFCDVTDRFQVYETADKVRQETGDVSLLVNNAGIVNGRWFMDIPDEKIEKVMEVNVIAHFWISLVFFQDAGCGAIFILNSIDCCGIEPQMLGMNSLLPYLCQVVSIPTSYRKGIKTLKAFLPHMMTLNHGHVVTISSIAGRNPTARLVDYCASKHGALGLHESVALELRALGKDGIQMTNICPFFINTGMSEGAKARLPFLLPLTEPDYVAERVVRAILLDQHQVYIPRSLYFLMPLRALLPRKAIIAIEDFLGVQDFMASFVGRERRKVTQDWSRERTTTTGMSS